MEKHKKDLILTHLPNLILFTKCCDVFLTILLQNKILSFTDIDIINAINEETGKASKLYEIIQTRRNSYQILLDALAGTNQRDIVELLTTGNLPLTLNLQHRTEQLFGKSREPVLFNVSPPDALFSGRSKELESLHAKIRILNVSGNAVVVVVCGLGGIGKSQLCRKYIESYRKDYGDNVIWFNAETESSLAQCFSKLAKEKLKLSTKDADGIAMEIETIVNEVYDFLLKRHCLLVFDNVEHSDYLRRYLPSNRTFPVNSVPPAVLMTSRETEWEMAFEVFKLSELTEEDAFLMVQNGLADHHYTNSSIHLLITRLQCYPLAIRQAISYIRQQLLTILQYRIENYLEDFEIRRKEMMSFHNSAVCTQLTNDYAWTTFTTWTVTTAKLSQTSSPFLSLFRRASNDKLARKAAMQILNAIAYIEPDVISLCTLKALFAGTGNEDAIQSSVRLLLKYSLISSNETKDVFSVHRLVQEVTRIKLSLRKMDTKILSLVLRAFSSNLKIENIDHAIRAWQYSNETVRINYVDLPSNIVRTLYLYQRYIVGNRFAGYALGDLQNLHVHRLSIRSSRKCIQNAILNLKYQHGISLRMVGRCPEALNRLLELLDECRNVPGMENHSLIFQTQLQIGRCFRDLGKFSEAVDYLVSAKEGFYRVNTEWIVDVDYTLALVHSSIATESSITECIKLLQKCYTSLAFSGKQPELLIEIANSLACRYIEQDNLYEAREILKENLKREKTFGGEMYAECSVSALYMARILRKEGKVVDALEEHQKIYNMRRQMWGDYEIYTLVTKCDVAEDLYLMKEYARCLAHFQEVHDSYVNVLGLAENHWRVLYCKEWIADTLVQLTLFVKALSVYKFLYNEQKVKFGEHHPITEKSAESISKIQNIIQLKVE